MRNKKFIHLDSPSLVCSVWVFGTKVLLVFPVIKDDEVLVSAEHVLSDDEVIAASVVCIVSQAFLIILDVGVRGVVDSLGIHER